MDFPDLKLIAEAMQTALLERQATGDISNFEIDVIPDDHKIDICIMKKVSVEHVACSLKIYKRE